MAVGPAVPTIMSPEYEANTIEVFGLLREHYPLQYDETIEAWLVSRHEDIRTVFRHPEITSDNYEWQFEETHGRTILQMYGKEHAQHRRLLNPFFTGAGLEGFVPVIERTARSVLGPVVARESTAAATDLIEPIVEREAAAVARGARAAACFDLVSEFARLYRSPAARRRTPARRTYSGI